MKYILLIYGDENGWESLSKEEMERIYAEHGAYAAAMEEAGVIRGGAELKPTTTATSIRFSNGKAKTVDGPFAETKEQLGGFYLVEVASMDEAVEWAKRVPRSPGQAVEVRAVPEV